MKRLSKKRRRGDIMVVLVFSVVMAILMLGMLRVAMTLYASGRMQEGQYADIQTMRAINEVACYAYVSDLEACHMTRNADHDYAGVSDSVVLHESLEALQKSMANYGTGAGEQTDQFVIWKVRDAGVAVGAAGFNVPDALNPTNTVLATNLQTDLMSLVSGRAHEFTLELEEDLTIDATDMGDSYVGAVEARVKLRPVLIKTTLRIKTETVINHFSVEGLYIYTQRSQQTDASGNPYTRIDMVITDDGNGSGVHIYRAD